MPNCSSCSKSCQSAHGFCVDCVEKSPRSLKVRAKLRALEADRARLEAGGELDLCDPAAREILAHASTPDLLLIYVGRVAKDSKVSEVLCRKVLQKAGVKLRDGKPAKKKSSRIPAKCVSSDEAWDVVARVAGLIKQRRAEAMALSNRSYKSVTREEFVEYFNRPQVNKAEIYRLLGYSRSAVRAWREGLSIPPPKVQVLIRRLIDGQTLGEVFAADGAKPVVKLRPIPSVGSAPPPEELEDDDEDEEVEFDDPGKPDAWAKGDSRQEDRKMSFRPGRIELSEGDVFGEWTVISQAKKRGKKSYVLCKCSCGKEREVQVGSLVGGGSKKCSRNCMGPAQEPPTERELPRPRAAPERRGRKKRAVRRAGRPAPTLAPPPKPRKPTKAKVEAKPQTPAGALREARRNVRLAFSLGLRAVGGAFAKAAARAEDSAGRG